MEYSPFYSLTPHLLKYVIPGLIFISEVLLSAIRHIYLHGIMMRITRSSYLSALRCPRKVYFQVHGQSRESSSDPATRMFVEQGRKVAAVARQAFKGGESVEWKGAENDPYGLERTALLVQDPEVRAIYGGVFEQGEIFVRVDILERLETGAWRLVLVKPAASLKENHFHELALMKYVLEACGLKLEAFSVMHLNRAYEYGGGEYDATGLFSMRDAGYGISSATERLRRELPRILEILGHDSAPEASEGPYCQRPSRCDFLGVCQTVPHDPDWIGYLPEATPELLDSFARKGVVSIRDIPPAFSLNPRQRRARESCLLGAAVFDPCLADELNRLSYPLLFMDFEASSPALPRFTGMHPFDPVPFQWSLHILDAPGAQPVHREFLDCGKDDPRERFIRSLLDAAEGYGGSLVVYNQDFESDRLKELGTAFPELRGRIDHMRGRLWDLCAVVQNNVYHPRMRGSFSIKSVLPALAPDMSYEGLTVSNGVTAGAVCHLLVEDTFEDAERERMESALREYCRLDTLAMLRLVECLQAQLAAGLVRVNREDTSRGSV